MLSPAELIDKFLDWIDELSSVDVVAQRDGQVSKSKRWSTQPAPDTDTSPRLATFPKRS
jgi:hypothetical protein